MEIALVTEGTYPYYTGGVSVWCHQLIEGMPDHNFHVVAVSVNGLERSIWTPPSNLVSVTNLPLWGFEKTVRRAGVEPPPAWFEQIHLTFLRILIRPTAVLNQRPLGIYNSFLNALHAMFRYAQEADLSAALLSNRSLERLMDLWHSAEMDEDVASPGERAKPILTLADALMVSDFLEHLLRPLSRPPLRVDLVHSAMNGLSTLAGMASKWTYGAPLVLSEHGIYLRERYLSYLNDPMPYAVKMLLLNFFRLLNSAAYQVADIIAPHSRYNRRWQLHNGARAAQLRTMYNGVDPSEFFPSEEVETDTPTMVFMGRIDPLKDLHTLIRSFALVKDNVPKARLRIFGPVPIGNEVYYGSCVKLIEELGLSDSVRFEGRVKHPADAYRAGHVVVLSSISEGFPYTVIEAMACGRATVSTNVGGVAEGVGEAGIVVAPRDVQGIAEACVKLLDNPELRHSMGTQARERILQKFTLEQSIEAYRDAYDEALRGPSTLDEDRADVGLAV